MTYIPANDRYDSMPYRNCGSSGLKMPLVSLGLWHNFGDTGNYENMKGIRIEAKQKLAKIRPRSIGQASRISGISPADISVLLIYLEQRKNK